METDDCIKLVIGTAKPCFNAKIVLGDNEYFEIYNKNEPFDLSNHVFMLPKPTAIAGKNAVFCCDTEGNEHAENFVLDYSLESASKKRVSASPTALNLHNLTALINTAHRLKHFHCLLIWHRLRCMLAHQTIHMNQ